MTAKTIYSPEYRRLVQKLRLLREEAGITQSALSLQLGWPQQRLSAIEAGARRLDVMEFLHLTEALGKTPEAAIRLVVSGVGTPAKPMKAKNPSARRKAK
jgi:transcriptional regulator with XRE-family HTH domain